MDDHDDSLLIQRPDGAATRLVLMFHGVGATADDLVPLGELIARRLPGACVVSVSAPHASDLGRGRQWFSVAGVSEANRPSRVAEAMPAFDATVAHWQRESGVGPEATVLIGFSQGAIMSLESAVRAQAPARQVIALAGRFAAAPTVAAPGVRIDLIHGTADGVMPARLAEAGATQLRALGVPVTLALVPGLGHGIDARAAGAVMTALGFG